MLNKKQMIEEQKDCAEMLGMTLKDYQSYVKNTKVPNVKSRQEKRKYDNSVLTKLGLSTSDLKTRKGV